MKKSEVQRLSLEGALIVFSVLFALFIGQLVETNKIKKQKEQAIEYIYQELGGNRNTLKRWVEKHGRIRDNLARMTSDPNDSLRQLLFKGVQLDYGVITNQEPLIDALLGNTAWEAAKSTQIISEFNFERVQEFTRIYGLQQVIMDGTITKFTDVYFDRASQNKENTQSTLVQLQLIMMELVGQEETLIYMLDQLIDDNWTPSD